MGKQGYTRRHMLGFAASAAAMLMAGCGPSPEVAPAAKREAPLGAMPPLFDDLQQRTFRLLLGDRQPEERPGARPLARRRRSQRRGGRRSGSPPTRSACERGYVTREQARERALATLRFFADAPQGDAPTRHDRPPRLLLPLPRHGDRHAHRRRGAVHRRHRAAAGRRAVLRRPTSTATDAGEVRDPRAGGPHLPPRGLALGAAAPAGDRARLDARGTASSPYDWRGYNEAMLLYLLALGSPTHPGRARRRGTAWTQAPTTPGARFHGQRARRLRAALRPPVLARLGRFPRHPGRVHARARARLLREQPPRHARAARLRDRQPRRVAGLRRRRLGPHRLRRPGRRRSRDRAGRVRTFHDYTARGAGPRGHRSTTARSRPPRPARRCPSRRRSSIPARGGHARALRRAHLPEVRLPRRLQPQLHRSAAPR